LTCTGKNKSELKHGHKNGADTADEEEEEEANGKGFEFLNT